MGEIGRDRHEYLYEMLNWEILLIQRGYRRRNVLQYQLQRLQAYGAMFAMSGSKKEPCEWLPMYFDRYIQQDSEPLSEQDKNEMLELMASINSKPQP